MSGIRMDINPEIIKDEQLFRMWLIQALGLMQASIDEIKTGDIKALKDRLAEQEIKMATLEKNSWRWAGGLVTFVFVVQLFLAGWRFWK